MAKPAISDDQLKAITDSEIRASVAYLGGKLSEQRRRNEYFYLGLAQGELAAPDIEGRSKVVDTSVRDTVEWMLTSLVKIFTAGDKAVEFAPRSQQDEKAAEAATDYVNYVFYTQNSGYNILHTAIKDSLVQKTGVVKVWWDTRTEDCREEYKGIDAIQLAMLLQDDTVELLEKTEYPDPSAAQAPQMPAQGAPGAPQPPMPMPGAPTPAAGPQGAPIPEAPDALPAMLYDVAVKRVVSNGRVRIENVPPEEFLISRKAKSIDDTPFVAHRVEKTISELKALGYKNLEQISTDESAAGSMNAERIERRSYDDELPYLPSQSDVNYDPSMRIVWLTECYLQADRNGDGIAEWLKVTRAGNALLEVEEVDGNPFAAAVPIPLPHRFFGLALADLLIQAQMTKTSILRAALDGFYVGVNGRYFAVEGQVNLDDLLVSRPGGVVRVKQPTAVGRLDSNMADLGSALSLLEYTETQKENASGWTRYSQGTSADALNKTATGTSIITNRSDARTELMARNIAETGVKRMFQLILKLVSQHQDKPAMMRLNGAWTPIDPREWKTQFDITVNVGIGTGNKDQVVAKLMNLHGIQVQAAQMGYATPKNLWYGAGKVTEAMGFKQPELFFTDPTSIPKPPPPPPPEVLKMQADMQAKQAQLQFDMQQAQMKLQADAHRFAEEMKLARDKLMVDLEMKREELEAEIALKRELAAMQVGAAQEARLYKSLYAQGEVSEAAEVGEGGQDVLSGPVPARPKRRVVRHIRDESGRIAASEIIDDDAPQMGA